jgi:hypothetical protein
MNALSYADEMPVGPFRLRSMEETGIPSHGDGNRAAVDKIHDQGVGGERDALGQRSARFSG